MTAMTSAAPSSVAALQHPMRNCRDRLEERITRWSSVPLANGIAQHLRISFELPHDLRNVVAKHARAPLLWLFPEVSLFKGRKEVSGESIPRKHSSRQSQRLKTPSIQARESIAVGTELRSDCSSITLERQHVPRELAHVAPHLCCSLNQLVRVLQLFQIRSRIIRSLMRTLPSQCQQYGDYRANDCKDRSPRLNPGSAFGTRQPEVKAKARLTQVISHHHLRPLTARVSTAERPPIMRLEAAA